MSNAPTIPAPAPGPSHVTPEPGTYVLRLGSLHVTLTTRRVHYRRPVARASATWMAVLVWSGGLGAVATAVATVVS